MEVIQERPTTTGVDVLHALLERIAALEVRVQELEHHSHHEHTIDSDALRQIADIVKTNIAHCLYKKAEE